MREVTYRLSLGLAGLIWICIASTFCGCNQTSGYMNNQAGKGFYQQGNYTAARRSFEQALMDNPQKSDYAFNVAAAMRKQGDLLGAERMYKHALTINPNHQPAYHGMASMLREQGRTAEADDLLTAWNQTQPYSAESYVEVAWMQQQNGDLPGAERSLQQALRIDPRHPKALAHLGHIYQRTGRGGEAAGLYRQSLAMNPYQPQVQSNLGQLAQPAVPSAALQMAQQMPLSDPTMAAGPSVYTAQMPVMPADGMYMSQTAPPGSMAPPPGAQWSPEPSTMVGPASPYGSPLMAPSYGAPAQSPGSQPVQLGPLAPVSNADPAHAPIVGSAIPMVSAF
jgi:Tfp pilus assembly protein PilF